MATPIATNAAPGDFLSFSSLDQPALPGLLSSSSLPGTPLRSAFFQGLTTDSDGRPRFARSPAALSPAGLSPTSTVGSSLFDDSEPPPLSLDEEDFALDAPACSPGATSAAPAAANLAADGGRKLRIAIVTENFLPKVDGVTRTLSFLLDYLESQGHEAIIVGPGKDDHYLSFPHLRTPGLPLSSLGVYGDGLSLNFFSPSFIPRLMKFRPDLLHFVDPIWLGTQGLPITEAWLGSVAKVASFHTNLATYSELFGFGWLGLPQVMWALQRYLHSRLLMTFVPSPSTSSMLVSHGFRASNLRIWPRGVDTSFFSADKRLAVIRRRWLSLPAGADTEARTVLLYVGRVSWEKNLRLLIEAFREVARQDRDTVLVVVGDGPARADMERMCVGYGLEGRVVFEGHTKGEQLARLFASADVFCFPSWTETFGQVVVEAQASSLPVVGLRAEGVRDLVEHEQTGLLLDMNALDPAPLPTQPHKLFAPGSASFALASQRYAALVLSLCGPAARPRRCAMGRRAAGAAGRHDWSEAMGAIVAGYREAVDINRARVHRARERKLARARVGTSVFGRLWPAVPPPVPEEAGEAAPAGAESRATPASLFAADKSAPERSLVAPRQHERHILKRNRILRQAILRFGGGAIMKLVILVFMLYQWLSWLVSASSSS